MVVGKSAEPITFGLAPTITTCTTITLLLMPPAQNSSSISSHELYKQSLGLCSNKQPVAHL